MVSVGVRGGDCASDGEEVNKRAVDRKSVIIRVFIDSKEIVQKNNGTGQEGRLARSPNSGGKPLFLTCSFQVIFP